MRVKAWIYEKTHNAIITVHINPSVPDTAVTSLTCSVHPTTCSVQLDTTCDKQNGPGLAVSYDLAEQGSRTVILPDTVVDYQGRARLSLPKDLTPNTHYTLTAYPANDEGRSTDTRLKKVAEFTSPPVPGAPVITHQEGFDNNVIFAWTSDSNSFSYQTKTKYKACPDDSPLNSWSSWSARRQYTMLKAPYSTLSMRVKAKNSNEKEGSIAEESVDVGPSVPDVAITSLTCPGLNTTFCSVQLETTCEKQNGPGLTLSYDLRKHGNHQVLRTVNISATVIDDQGRARFSLPKDLMPNTNYTLTAYPANDVGRNNDTRLTKVAEFTSPPGDTTFPTLYVVVGVVMALVIICLALVSCWYYRKSQLVAPPVPVPVCPLATLPAPSVPEDTARDNEGQHSPDYVSNSDIHMPPAFFGSMNYQYSVVTQSEGVVDRGLSLSALEKVPTDTGI